MPRRLQKRRLGIARGTNQRGAANDTPPDPVETFRVLRSDGAFVKTVANEQVIHD